MNSVNVEPAKTRSADHDGVVRNKKRTRTHFYMALMFGDAVALLAGFMLAGLIRFHHLDNAQTVKTVVVMAPLFLIFNSRGYCADILVNWRRGIAPALGALFAALVIVLFLGFSLKASARLSRFMLVLGVVISFSLLAAIRAAIGQASRRSFHGWPMSSVLIADRLEVPRPAGFHRLNADRIGFGSDFTDPVALDRLAQSLANVDRVVVACPPERRGIWSMALKGSDTHAELMVPELGDVGVIGSSYFAGVPTVLVSTGPLDVRDQFNKRLLDLAIALPALLFLAPLLLIVAVAIRLETAGSPLFYQRRVGLGNRLFWVYKFRSMRQEAADSDGRTSASRDDARITRVGRFIRSTSIDALPQLLNIVRGEMSFVGPRPHALGSLAGDQLFWEVDARYSHRHACKPGLTGLAQIRGFRGATHRREDLVNRLQADLEYLNGWSVWRDLSILVATVKVVVHRNAF